MPDASDVIETLRKPEIRTQLSDILVKGAKRYFQEFFEQKNPPELVTSLKNAHTVFLIEGSALRGTSDPKVTHDIDILDIYDDSEKPFPPNYIRPLGFSYDILNNRNNSHPSGQRFQSFLLERYKTEPSVADLYAKRLSETFTPSSPQDAAEKYLLTFDSAPLSTPDIIENGINSGTLKDYSDTNELRPRHLISLLTTIPSLVYETTPGTLLYHQRRIVEAFAKLKRDDPKLFEKTWKEMSDSFPSMQRYTAWKHPETDSLQLRAYLERSGRFSPQKLDHAITLLKEIRKQQKLPSFETFQNLYGVGEK